MRPATDLCWTCQKNNNRIRNSANLPESDKAEAVRAQEQHLLLATGERNFYKNCCRESKEGIQEYLKVVDFTVEHEPCLYEGTVHYSYDYVQQLPFFLSTWPNLFQNTENVLILVFAVKQFHD